MITLRTVQSTTSVSAKIMKPGNKSFTNETSYGIGGSFPHYKHIIMPADQKAKLLAMHRASSANAGIYVAVVIGIYLILLTMLLCRYWKRGRPSSDAASLLTVPPGIPAPVPERSGGCYPFGGRCQFTCHFTPARFRTFYKSVICCCRRTTSNMDESTQEIADYPLTTLTPQIECKDRFRRKNKPVPV